jgi:hypothetical protein
MLEVLTEALLTKRSVSLLKLAVEMEKALLSKYHWMGTSQLGAVSEPLYL